MKTNHWLLKVNAALFLVGAGTALVVACSSNNNNPAPSGSDGSASSSGGSSSGTSSGSSSGGSSSSGASSSGGSSSGGSSGAACVPDGGDAATCNSCLPAYCPSLDAGGCLNPYNACSPYTTGCIPFTGSLPTPYPKF
jgi:hypothetical protein